MAEETIQLYEFPRTRSARCRWMLQELHLEFESVLVDLSRGEHRTPEFLAINPFGRVPVLEDGSLRLFESIAICTHLAEKYPRRGKLPAPASAERAVHDQWLFFCATELEQPLWRIRRHTVLLPEDKRLPAEVDLAREDFSKAARVMEESLVGTQYLVGNRFTVADVVVAYTLWWANWQGLLDDFPALQDYLSSHSRRPSFPEELRG